MNPKNIITLVVLIFSAVLLFILVLPQFGKAQTLAAKLSAQKKDLAEVKSKFETTKLAILQFKKLTPKELERTNSALPDDADLPDLLVLVDKLITQAGLTGEDINISVPSTEFLKQVVAPQAAPGAIAPRFLAPQEVSGRGEIDINFSVVGSYESFKFFLGRLEKSLRVFNLQSVSFSTPQAAEKIAGAFRFGVSVKTYYNK